MEEWASSEPDYIQKNQFSVSFRDFLTIRNIWMIANRKNAKQCWVNLSSQSKQEVKPGNFEINKSEAPPWRLQNKHGGYQNVKCCLV